jgi:acid phosphatase (class A)
MISFRPAHGRIRIATLLFILATAGVRAEGPYLHGFDAIALLPPPPALHSPEDQVDRETAFRVYTARTPEEVATAKAEHKVTIFAFAPAIGPFFTPDRFPKTAALFKEVDAEAKPIIDGAKDTWKRPRPFVADPARFTEPGDPEKTPDYPSGHSTHGTLFALLLAEIFPNQRDAILAKGRDIGWVRVEAGVHTPLAIYGGRVLGQSLAEAFLRSPAFQADLAAARAEAASAQP